eukprot:jgi/Botrbrau1/10328/Bobra.0321s0006.1
MDTDACQTEGSAGSPGKEMTWKQEAENIMSAMDLLHELAEGAEDLGARYREMMSSLRSAVHDATECTLEHLLLYDAAAEELQDATMETTASANQLVEKCIALSTALRGTDLLAEHVRQVRRSVEQLGSLIDSLP